MCPAQSLKCQRLLTLHLLAVHSVDGHPLNIKQLRGEEPVEIIDLSGKNLGVASAIIIASLIASNTATKTLKCARPQHTVLCASSVSAL